MPRELRSRASRPNYAQQLGIGLAEDEAGPPLELEDMDDGDDFAPAAGEQDEDEDDVISQDAPDDDLASIAPGLSTAGDGNAKTPSAKAKGKRKAAIPPAAKSSARASVALAPGLSHPLTRQTYALPSVHHRHRPLGIYRREGQAERLIKPPVLFEQEETVLTFAWASTPAGSLAPGERVNKAFGFSVGSGPLWELVEDRAWYKEGFASERVTERDLRPRVYESLKTSPYESLSARDAAYYLPHDATSTVEDGSPIPPPPIVCAFGPFGNQVKVEMRKFETLKMSSLFPDSRSHVFAAGAPVWGIDWCPIHPDDRAPLGFKQYLAVGPFPSHTHSPMIGSRVRRPSLACIQIWSLSKSPGDADSMDIDNADPTDDAGEMRCELVLCLEGGPAFDLKWCPLPSSDPFNRQSSSRKLGILGGTFEDGSLSFYVVPDPATLPAANDALSNSPKYVKLSTPLLRIELEDTMCWSFDWANSEVVAVGCTNGFIAVYDVGKAFNSPGLTSDEAVLPTHYFRVHQSAIRTIAWVRAPAVSGTGQITAGNPTVIASGGYDGMECVSDIREMSGNVMNRTRDVVHSVCYSTFCGGTITIDHENIVKIFSLSPSMLARGHTLLEPEGPVWDLAVSDHHPQLALGVTDGSCLTTNTMRTTRKGGAVPFWVHKIYQLDYSRNSGEYRMLERFLPKEADNRPAANRANRQAPFGTGVWPPQVGVQRVVWNDGNGLGRIPLLASATGSGLCRVDWLPGRWMKDTVPYSGIEGIRGERGGVEDDDESD